MRFALLAVLLVFVSPAAAQETIRPSVVKIHTTKRFPNPYRPWTKEPPKTVSGSGVVIDVAGKLRILTNAHVVSYSREIYVQGYQSADKIEAKLLAIAPGMDLALLELDDSFFKNRPALPLAEGLPKIKDAVNAYGYPTGGEEMSVTEGIISRIEIAGYNYGNVGLRIQVDAALNPGNSGGPTISDNKIAGIVFSGIPSADNIGYLIPADEIRMFLADIADGKYDGKPHLTVGMQISENDAMREMLKLDAKTTGVIISRPEPGEDFPLKEWDLVTHIGEHPIDNDGRVQVRDDLRISFRYFVPKLAKDGTVELTVLRKGETKKVNVPVPAERDHLVPPLKNDYPRYFMIGPLVFTAATRELVVAGGQQMAGMLSQFESPLLTRLSDVKAFKDEELVAIASPMFSHRITKGYNNPILAVVSEVNGVKIKNLRHLVEIFRDAKDEFIVIKFDDKRAESIVFKRKEMLASTDDILNDNGIRESYSKDLRDAWEKE